jgi:glycosyltransferase involved in cell wall biosynthesis
MAAGLPVVAIKSPGIDDLIDHGKTGILTGFQNGDLASGILYLAGDKPERARLGYNGYQNSHLYHINHTVGHTIQLYKRLLDGNSREHTNAGRDDNKIFRECPGSKSFQRRAYKD